MTERIRIRYCLSAMTLVLIVLTANSLAFAQTKVEEEGRKSVSTGERVFSAGHSFHVFVPRILNDVAKAAGIKDHDFVGLSAIGGSRVIQHWKVPEERNKAKKALRTGTVDVLTLSPIHLPDEGIENFVKLALKHNPKVRVTVQEFWLPFDIYDTTFKLRPRKVDHNAPTAEQLRKLHAPYFKSMDEYVMKLNREFDKPVLSVVPAGQAVIALREKIIAGEAFGLKQQNDLFADAIGHATPPLQTLVAYCHFAVIYKRSPVGLPMPAVLEKANNPEWDTKLNRLLQELAWDAVTHHPLSGVKSTAKSGSESSATYDWPQWRGPSRDGVVRGFSIPKAWPESLERQWSVEVGQGHSSPVVADRMVYQLSRVGDEEHVHCLKLATGETAWHASYPASGGVHSAAGSHGIGPKSTPVVDRGKVYTLGIGSILSCFDAKTGKLLWRETFDGRFPKPAPSCGTSMSPLIVGNRCIVHVGLDRQGALLAFDAETGEQRWEYDGDGPGYGSPIVASLSGRLQIVTPVSKFVAGIDIDSGKMLWREPFPTRSTQNIITPIQYRDMIITGGIGQPTVALRPREHNGTVKATRIWENKEVPLHMSSPVVIGDKLIGLSHMKAGHLFCLDVNTGETLWHGKGRLAKNVALLATSNRLAVLTSDGVLIFGMPTQSGLDHLAAYPVDPDGRTWAHPVLLGKRILVKSEMNLICWSLP